MATALSDLNPLQADTNSKIAKIDDIIAAFQTAKNALLSAQNKQGDAKTLGEGASSEVTKAYNAHQTTKDYKDDIDEIVTEIQDAIDAIKAA